MKSFLQQLENNEAILLMYIADELPPQDRAEVEEMLASDSRLRLELENLRQTEKLAFDALRSLDSITRPPISAMSAQNRVGKLTRVYADRQRAKAGEFVLMGPRFPWWRSAMATAAALMVGYYIWAVYHTPLTHNLPPVAVEKRSLDQDEKLALLDNSFQETTNENANVQMAEVAEAANLADADVAIGNRASDLNSSGEQ